MAKRDFADCKGIDQLARVMTYAPKEVEKEVRDTNKAFATRLSEFIRAVAPKTGGAVQHRSERSQAKGASRRRSRGHDTPAGAFRASIRPFAYLNSAGVRGGNKRAPHFIVNEFGGSVWWMNDAIRGGAFNRGTDMSKGWTRRRWGHKSTAAQFANTQRMNKKTGQWMGSAFGGHIIPVRERSPMNTVKGDLGGERHFPKGLVLLQDGGGAHARGAGRPRARHRPAHSEQLRKSQRGGMSDKLALDLDDLTLGEMEDFEKASGLTLSTIQDGNIPAKALIALVWIARRRDDPKYTLKDARSVKISDLQLGADPTAAEPETTT